MIAVTTAPHIDPETNFKDEPIENTKITTYIESEFFTVYKWIVEGMNQLHYNDKYLLFSVLDGKGQLLHNSGTFDFDKGSHFIVPVGFGEFQIDETCELMVSHA